MIFNINPYVVGNPVGGTGAFVGRGDVLREVFRILRSPDRNAMVLYGKKQIGKTSMLEELESYLPQKGEYAPIYFDFKEKAALSPEQILRDLTDRILERLDIYPPDSVRDDFLAEFKEDFLPQVLFQLPGKASLIFLFDEFDVLDILSNEQAVTVFFPYLKELMQTDKNLVKFIFVISRRPSDLSKDCLPLFDGAGFCRLSLLSREDTTTLVNLSQKNASLRWPDEMIEEVQNLTGGHPYLVQRLCQIIWEKIYDRNPEEIPVVAGDDISESVPEALESSENALEHLWDGLGLAERLVASALAEAGYQLIGREEFERYLQESGAHILIGDLQNVPRVLEEWDLIQSGKDGYRIRIEMWRRWLVQHKPLARVQEEIDRILNAARHLFKAAYEFYKEGELDDASPLLQQVVQLDPNRRKAIQLLTEIFLARGNIGEALELLESLYKYNPWAARPRLVQALVTQAEEKSQDNEKLLLYEKVLELDPDQPEALAEYQRLCERQGDIAYKNDEFDKALESYKKVNATEKIGKVNRRFHLEDLYQRALDALKKNKREKAQRLLAEVLSIEPSFREATRYMHLAVTGSDTDSLFTKLKHEVTSGLKGSILSLIRKKEN
ncbi:tetratricopeptide repeat protein [Desulfococcaceae bacterium HSG8]|nr:tetratricopeptide repeat protein [Desulfococcaceae bacterium HSG8]